MASQLRQRLHRSHGVEITAGRLLDADSIATLRKGLAQPGAPAETGP
jgi:hypothetical protein